MAHKLALIRGEEFADAFQDVHASLVADLGGEPRVAFLPTPAANDGIETVEHWCSLAREKLSALGAMVDTPRVVDRESANDSHYAQQIAEANWVYLGGGYAHVALPILQDTKVIEGKFALRACIVNFRTSLADIEVLPEIVLRIGRPVDTELRPEGLQIKG